MSADFMDLPPVDQEPPYDPAYDHTPPAPPALEDETPTPHARNAEMALLGAVMNMPDTATRAATLIDPSDFYYPNHETIWDAIQAVTATGAKAEPTLILDHLTRTKQLRKIGGAPYLFELIQAGFHGQLDEYARIVRDTARLRTALHATTKVRAAIASARPETIQNALDQALMAIDQAAVREGATTHTRTHHVETIDDLLAGDTDDTYDWVIPGLLEHQERVILTAEEGAGKTTLLRQIAIQAAAGIHPFTGDPIDPITVLHIDVENTRRQSRRLYRPLRIQAGARLQGERLRVELRTAGIDLTTDADRDWLLDTARYIRPDLLLIGPIYKLANGDPTEEKSAKPVAMAIDTIRDQTDCAVILEAHAAKAPTGQKKRPHEPYGWSGWLRWPEIGLWLDRNGTLTPWRGAREERAWPDKLDRGGDWPWSPALTEIAVHWNSIRIARERRGTRMSMRDVADATGMSLGAVQRLIGRNAPYSYGWTLINGRSNNPSEDEE